MPPFGNLQGLRTRKTKRRSVSLASKLHSCVVFSGLDCVELDWCDACGMLYTVHVCTGRVCCMYWTGVYTGGLHLFRANMLCTCMLVCVCVCVVCMLCVVCVMCVYVCSVWCVCLCVFLCVVCVVVCAVCVVCVCCVCCVLCVLCVVCLCAVCVLAPPPSLLPPPPDNILVQYILVQYIHVEHISPVHVHVHVYNTPIQSVPYKQLYQLYVYLTGV